MSPKDNLAPVLHREEELQTKGVRKTKVIGAFFSSLLTGKTSLWESPAPEIREKSGERKNNP